MITIPAVIYKQWTYPANRKQKTQKIIHGMVDYIATRDGVELNPLKEENGEAIRHGLFGKVGTAQQTDSLNLEKTQEYIKAQIKSGKVIYNAAISFTEETAINKGLTKREVWENMLREVIPDICRHMEIPPRRIEYAAAVHMERGHPHLHLIYWDKEQGIQKDFINPAICDNIRKDITKRIMSEELQEIYAETDALKKLIKEFCGEETDILRKISESEAFISGRSAQKSVEACAKPYLDMCKYLRNNYKRGAYKFKYLPENCKNKVLETVDKLITSNPDLKLLYSKYMNAVKKQTEIYGGKENVMEMQRKFSEDLKKDLANILLKSAKETNTEIREKEMLHNQQVVLAERAVKSLCRMFGGHIKNQDPETAVKKDCRNMSQLEKGELKSKRDKARNM